MGRNENRCEHCNEVPSHFDAFGHCNSCMGINSRFAFATLDPLPAPARPLVGVSPSMVEAAEHIASGKTVRLQGLEIQTSRVFLVFEPPSQGSVGGLVMVGEYTSGDHFRVLHGGIPEIFAMYLAPILALGFAKLDLQRATVDFATVHGAEFKRALLEQKASADVVRLESEVAALKKALAATGGAALENHFQVLPDQCDFTDPVHGRCMNKPTGTVPMQVALCDAHREAETVEIGGVDVEPGTFN